MPSKGAPNMLPNVLPHAGSDHVPVLAEEVRELLAVRPGDTVVDATFGAGGHARVLAQDLAGSGKLVAIDRDPGAKPYFDRFKAGAGVEVRFLRGDFAIVLSQLAGNGVKADAVLLDLGISSMQIDRPERGFSYATDAPLDMRMDPSSETTAATIVNTWDERELVTIFRRYGEERYATQIARAIVRTRAERSFTRTGELVDTIKLAIPTPARFGEGHPAKRVFQALRIAVNDELGQLEAALPAAARDAPSRRPARGDLVPLARGPHREALRRRRGQGLHLPARLPGVRLREGADAQVADPEARPTWCAGDRRQSARCLGTPAGGGEGLMSTIAQPALRRPRLARGAFTGGILWIVLVAALLAGVVAINVLVLRLNVRLDDLRHDRAELKAEIASTRAQLSSASANARIETEAASKLGLVEADPNATTYVRLAP